MAAKSGNGKMFTNMVFSAIFRRRSRAVMAVVATLIGSATLSCLALIAIAVPQQMTTEMREFGANLIVTPAAGDRAQNVHDSTENGISAQTVEQASQVVTAQGNARMATYRYENVRVNSAPYVVAGIDVEQVENLNRHWNVDGAWPSVGNVLMGRDTADLLGLDIGSSVTIGFRGDTSSSKSATVGAAPAGVGESVGGPGAESGAMGAAGEAASTQEGEQGAIAGGHNAAQTAPEGAHGSTDILDTEGQVFRVGGIVDTGGSEDQIIYMVKPDVEKLTGAKRGVDVVEFSSEAPAETLPQIAKSINDDSALHVKAEQVTKMTSSDTRIIAMLQTLFWIVSLVVLGLTLVGVGTTISSIVSQRRNEIGLRKALGASQRAVAGEFLSESALFGLSGGVVGALVGYGLARLLCTQVFGRTVDFSWLLALVTVVLSMLVAVLASTPPVRRATRIDPAIVLSEE